MGRTIVRFSLLVFLTLLSGCVTSTPQYVPPPLTDQQISEVNDSALCSLIQTNPDPRLSDEKVRRSLDCERTSLICGARGIKKGTKKFSKCKVDVANEIVLEEKKRTNPALGYCLDSGFTMGTEAIATCMASYNQQRQNEFALDRQQEFMERQMRQNNALLRQQRAQPVPVYQPAYQESVKTECRSALGGGFDCTTGPAEHRIIPQLLQGSGSANPTLDAFDARMQQLQ